MNELKYCTCQRWKDNVVIIDVKMTILALYLEDGSAIGLNLDMNYCPWCGEKLKVEE